MKKVEAVYVNGLSVYPFQSSDQLIDHVDINKGILVAVNAEKILHATEQSRNIVNRNIGYTDGIGAVWALRKKGVDGVKIPGCELWLDIITRFYKERTFYLIGGKQHVIDAVVEKLRKSFKGINIIGFRNGYLNSVGEQEQLLRDISIKKPHIVFVAMGSPKQELLMQEMQVVNPDAIYQGLGGSFDVYTGTVKRAPKIWVKFGLEWAYRWLKEPRIRTRRNIQLLRFLYRLSFNKFLNYKQLLSEDLNLSSTKHLEYMNHIKEAVLNYTKMNATGALLLTGEWGSGKTFFLKNSLQPFIEEKTDLIIVIISLFGENDKDSIVRKVLFSYLSQKRDKPYLNIESYYKGVEKVTEAFPKVKDYIDFKKLISGSADSIYKILPHDKLLICFDDIERMQNNSSYDFSGLINELIENVGSKVLLIANEKKIKKGIQFKEKIIDKTLVFHPDYPAVFDDIIKSYDSNKKFFKFLNDNKKFILRSIEYRLGQTKHFSELKESFSNLRSLKFALEHFNYVHAMVVDNNKSEVSENVLKNQLRNLWSFVLFISIEFKKENGLTFEDRKQLDQSVSLLALITSKLKIPENNGDEEDMPYPQKFIEKYYERISEQFIFYSDVYDFITAGIDINSQNLITKLNNSFNIRNGEITPAHELLNTFSNIGYYTFKNEEFKEKLEELLRYSSEGEFLDLMSYFNASAYLVEFCEFLTEGEEELLNSIKQGLAIFFDKSFDKEVSNQQIQMLRHSKLNKIQKELLHYIEQIIDDLKNEELSAFSQRMESLFFDEPEKFMDEILTDESSGFTPLFGSFDKNKLSEVIPLWQPATVMKFVEVVKKRYLETDSKELIIKEGDFLKKLNEIITPLPRYDKLSFYIYNEFLVPLIDQVLNDGS